MNTCTIATVLCIDVTGDQTHHPRDADHLFQTWPVFSFSGQQRSMIWVGFHETHTTCVATLQTSARVRNHDYNRKACQSGCACHPCTRPPFQCRLCPEPEPSKTYVRVIPAADGTGSSRFSVQTNHGSVNSPELTWKPQHFQESPHRQPLGPSNTRTHPPMASQAITRGSSKAGRTHV